MNQLAPNVPGCSCRNPNETWDDVDDEAPVVLCALHEQRYGSLRRDTLLLIVIDFEAALHQMREAAPPPEGGLR
jgi:hypothetical protein